MVPQRYRYLIDTGTTEIQGPQIQVPHRYRYHIDTGTTQIQVPQRYRYHTDTGSIYRYHTYTLYSRVECGIFF